MTETCKKGHVRDSANLAFRTIVRNGVTRKQTVCTVPGCENPVHRNSYDKWCPKHSGRFYRHGTTDPHTPTRWCSKIELMGFIEKRIKINLTTGCWEWQGYLDTTGSGNFLRDRAYRSSYKIYVGKIPTGLHVCHKCDNRRCVNPLHLFLGTALDNKLDAAKKGKSAKALTPNDVMEIRKRLSAGETSASISRSFGVASSCIRSIKIGNTWAWL